MRKRRNILLALSWYHPKIHEGIAAFASEHHWHLNTEITRQASHIPYGWNGDGIICQGQFTSNEQTNFFNGLKQPKVILTHNYNDFENEITVSDDHEAIATLAADHLIEHNFTNFACYCPNIKFLGTRIKHFQQHIEKAGFNCQIIIGKNYDKVWSSNRQWLKEQLEKLPKPIAIFAQNDEFASEVIEVCMDADIPIPDDVAVIGVRNDKLICETLNVPLTSVDNNLFGIGFKAAEQLNKIISGEKPEIRHHVIPPLGVQQRQSTNILALPAGCEKLHKALLFIRENYARPITTEMIAMDAAMSKRALFKEFEQKLNSTPHREVTKLRLQKAIKLLNSTNLVINEIAEQSGFSSLRNFYNTFKRELNTTPNSYKKNNSHTYSVN